MLYSLSFHLYIAIPVENPVNPSLDSGTRWYGWIYIYNLQFIEHIILPLIYIYVSDS